MTFLAFVIALITAGDAQAWSGSPNGFSAGQCTWYCDGRANESGWRLKFSQTSGRDARRWYDLVTNGYCAAGARAGSIMVLDGWSGNPAGHVAYVESVQSNGRWTVTHANWPGGTTVRTISGVPIRQVQFELVPGSTTRVRIVGGTSSFPLRGFIAR